MANNDTQPWVPITSRRSSTAMVEQVVARFFSGLEPGTRIGTEGELVEQFGVSRTTVREAIRELEARGVVETRRGKAGGIHIARSDPRRLRDALAIQVHLLAVDYDEMLEAQQALEPYSARLAAARATPQEVDTLAELLNRSRAATGDPERFVDLSVEFHLAIAEVAHSRVIHASLAALKYVQAEKHAPQTSRTRANRVITAHEGILEAISTGDEQLAMARMTEHLLVVRRSGSQSSGNVCAPRAVA